MWSGRLLFNRLPNFGRRVEAFWTNFSQCSAPLCSTSAWTYAFVCRYAKYVKSNVETPVVRTRRVGGRALAGRRRRGEKQRDRPRQKEREKGRAARRTERANERREVEGTEGGTRRKERGGRKRGRERPYFSGPCLGHVRASTHTGETNERPRANINVYHEMYLWRRVFVHLYVCVRIYIYIKKTHTYIRAHHIVTWPG